MQLFSVKKIGVFLDAIKHLNETRTSGEVKVITCTMRIEPFDAKLATALQDVVRTTLFRLHHPDPHPHILRCDFDLGCPRQVIEVFASSDTAKPSITFNQAKISRVYARTKKAANGYTLVFDATFGPVSKGELAYVEEWRGTQRACSFAEAEPSLEFEDDGAEDDEDERVSGGRPTPMFDTDGAGAPIDTAARPAADESREEPARQRIHSHQAGGKKARRGRATPAGTEE